MIINAFKPGTITVEGRKYRQDLIVLRERIICPWYRQESYIMRKTDIVLPDPDSVREIVIGNGANGIMQVDEEMLKELDALSIPVHIQNTPKACLTFNVLVRSGKNVSGYFHLT